MASSENDRIRRRLLEIRENHLMELRRRLKQAAELGDAGVPDPGDLGATEDLREYLHLLGERERGEIVKIDDALTRMDEGHYGICQECELPIGRDRLEVQPYTRYCRSCKEQLEARENILRGPGQGTI